MNRRRLLRGSAVLALGAGLGAVGLGELTSIVDRRAVRGAAAAATTRGPDGATGQGQLLMTWEVRTDRRLVALTFDDGPGPRWTPMVLDTLERFSVPATFFMVGQRVRQNPGIIRDRMASHEVGNHTWSHKDLSRLNDRQIRDELVRAHEAISEAVGVSPRLMRPPYGHVGGSAAMVAAELGYQMVLWSRKMCEASNTTETQIAAVLRETVPGTILLAHDVGASDRLIALRGLPQMITGLRDRGFKFVTVSQLLGNASAGAV
ncbi:MAG: polysaccharide deacetylase family protein [Micromonosporaceae bacterium]|nr:polysaccharide deacetylase family protein [Micromonosporaceae bacterium]